MGFGQIMGGVGVNEKPILDVKNPGQKLFSGQAIPVFSLVFPLVFLLIFGFMYSDQTTGPRDPVLAVFAGESFVDVEIINEVLHNTRELNFSYYPEKEGIERVVVNREASFGLILEQNELTFLFNPVLIQQNANFEEMARGIKASFEREKGGAVR